MHSTSQKVRRLLVLLFCLSASAYFSFHTFYGRYGLEAKSHLKERLSLLQVEITSLEADRSKLQNDVALLSLATPEPNFLEEVAGEMLGYVYPEDKVILLP